MGKHKDKTVAAAASAVLPRYFEGLCSEFEIVQVVVSVIQISQLNGLHFANK